MHLQENFSRQVLGQLLIAHPGEYVSVDVRQAPLKQLFTSLCIAFQGSVQQSLFNVFLHFGSQSETSAVIP